MQYVLCMCIGLTGRLAATAELLSRRMFSIGRNKRIFPSLSPRYALRPSKHCSEHSSSSSSIKTDTHNNYNKNITPNTVDPVAGHKLSQSVRHSEAPLYIHIPYKLRYSTSIIIVISTIHTQATHTHTHREREGGREGANLNGVVQTAGARGNGEVPIGHDLRPCPPVLR